MCVGLPCPFWHGLVKIYLSGWVWGTFESGGSIVLVQGVLGKYLVYWMVRPSVRLLCNMSLEVGFESLRDQALV